MLSLPALPYAYDALQPYMSAETLEYHHDKHHQTYVDTANTLAEQLGISTDNAPEYLVLEAQNAGHAGLFNNVAQHYNHLHFWQWMKPNGGGTKLPGTVQQKIDADLGGYDAFRAAFIEAGKTQFGSGWCWLAVNAEGKLEVMKTANGDNPLTHNATPILGCDVWEHSYYLDYRNARPKYLEAFVDHLINWDYVAERLETVQR